MQSNRDISSAWILHNLGGIAAAIFAACSSGLLQALLDGCATPSVYAVRLSLDLKATESILEVLEALGFCEHKGGCYGPTFALRALDLMQPGGVSRWSALWNQVPDFLLYGKLFTQLDDSLESREAYYKESVSSFAIQFAEAAQQLTEQIVVHPNNILDVGAGSGIWGLTIAERYPEAMVTGLDLPSVLSTLLKLASEMNLSKRVKLLPGDFFFIDIPEDYFNYIIVANVIHLESSSHAQKMIHRIIKSLTSDGILIIIGFMEDDSCTETLGRSLRRLHLALRSSQGHNHTLEEVKKWVRQEGLKHIEVIRFKNPPGLLAILADKTDNTSEKI